MISSKKIISLKNKTVRLATVYCFLVLPLYGCEQSVFNATASLTFRDAGAGSTDTETIHSIFDITPGEFAEARQSVEVFSHSENPDYRQLCMELPNGEFFYLGAWKFACRLREHPDFVFLFQRDPNSTYGKENLVRHELTSLSQIREQVNLTGRPELTIPFDNTIVEVPCVINGGDPKLILKQQRKILLDPSQVDKEHLCAGFLEPWLDQSSYADWKSVSEKRFGLFDRIEQYRFTMPERAVLCEGFRTLSILASIHKFLIIDLQGFFGIAGPDKGRIIVADPRSVEFEYSGEDPFQSTISSKCADIFSDQGGGADSTTAQEPN